jgi:hypothetical protein
LKMENLLVSQLFSYLNRHGVAMYKHKRAISEHLP